MILTVHPRVCGEQTQPPPPPKTSPGSSPRVRGTARVHRGHDPSLRFIPACAGNRISSRLASKEPPVHPRVCGEQGLDREERHDSDGSSPRVRGTDPTTPATQNLARFIPACAGNSPYNARMLTPPTVHPRVCGEQAEPAIPTRADAGSSPRVRGTDW